MKAAEDVARSLFQELADAGLGTDQWDKLTPKEQWTWVEAVRKSGAGGPFLIRAVAPMDLTEDSYLWARHVLGGVPHAECTIVHNAGHARVARDIADKWKCRVAEVPSDLMRSRYGWAVSSAAGCAWSEAYD